MNKMVEKRNCDIVPTQFIKKDFNLSEIVNEDFLEKIGDAFGANATVISLAILVDGAEEESKKELISFNYRNDKDVKNNNVLIDFNNPDSFEKIKRIL